MRERQPEAGFFSNLFSVPDDIPIEERRNFDRDPNELIWTTLGLYYGRRWGRIENFGEECAAQLSYCIPLTYLTTFSFGCDIACLALACMCFPVTTVTQAYDSPCEMVTFYGRGAIRAGFGLICHVATPMHITVNGIVTALDNYNTANISVPVLRENELMPNPSPVIPGSLAHNDPIPNPNILIHNYSLIENKSVIPTDFKFLSENELKEIQQLHSVTRFKLGLFQENDLEDNQIKKRSNSLEETKKYSLIKDLSYLKNAYTKLLEVSCIISLDNPNRKNTDQFLLSLPQHYIERIQSKENQKTYPDIYYMTKACLQPYKDYRVNLITERDTNTEALRDVLGTEFNREIFPVILQKEKRNFWEKITGDNKLYPYSIPACTIVTQIRETLNCIRAITTIQAPRDKINLEQDKITTSTLYRI